jgi:hypothetical protein
MYADATEIVNKLKKAICENNKEIINAIELSQREKDLMIKKMEAEFRSIVREAERIKVEEEREIRKTDTTKLKRGSGDIQYRELNQIILPVYLIFREMKLEDETKAPQVAILEISFSCPKNLKGFLV